MTEPIGLQQQFYEMLMDSQFWLAEQLRDYQRSQLGQLLRHARANVPFYERRLDAVLKPNGDIDWDRWGDIPIVKRQDMIDHRDAMQARELPKGHGALQILHTSGSTGLPIDYTVSGISGIAGNGFRWRMHGWQDLDWSKVLCNRFGQSNLFADWPDGEPLGFWGPEWDAKARFGGIWRIARDLPTREMLEFFVRRKCSYLNAGPNMAHINALDAERLGIEVSIEAILAQGNVVQQADRDACQRIFGAKIVEHYSSKEGGQMAHPCPLGTMHLNCEGALIEILDDNDRPSPVGKVGRVVVTPFFHTAQPLIRYEQGDLATLGPPCGCGRHLPTLQAVAGRSISIFRHPDGRAIAAQLPETARRLLQCSYFQVVQAGPLDFEIRYVPHDLDIAGDEDSVAAQFRETFFDDAALRFVRLRDLPLNRGGKLIEYLNEWSPAH